MAVAGWCLGLVLLSCLLIVTWADFGSGYLPDNWQTTSTTSAHSDGEYIVDVRDTGSGASVTIFASNASDGTPILDANLGAKLSPPDLYYPATPSDNVPGAYLISLYVSSLGSYSFRVLVCFSKRVCEPVDDKVYEFNVAGKVSARKSFASGSLDVYPVGQEASFNITAEDGHGVVETVMLDPNPFFVNISSTVSGVTYFTPWVIAPMGQGTYSVVFTPTRVQDYHVLVTLEGSQIFGGQWNFSTSQNELDDAAKFYLQPDREIGLSAVVVGPHTMSIRCSETSYVAVNKFTMVVSSATNNSAVTYSDSCPDSRFSVECNFELNITSPGKYSVLVSLGDTPIKNMPYYLTTLPGMAMASKSTIHVSSLKVKAGTSVYYNVDLVDTYGNPAASFFRNGLDNLQLIVGLFTSDCDPLFGDINPTVDGNGAPVFGSYTAAFGVKLAGGYDVKAYFGQSSVLGQFTSSYLMGSGFPLTVEASTPFAAKSLLELSNNISVGSATLAKLYIRDAYSNNVGMDAIAANRLLLYVFTNTHNFSYPISGVAEHFECIISGITRAQLYQVDVLLDGGVFLTGYEMIVVGGPISPQNCRIGNLPNITAGESGWFLLQLADKYKNNVTLGYDILTVDHLLHVRAMRDDVEATVHVALASRSFCNVTISTTRAGIYIITFGWAHNRVESLVTVQPGRLNVSQIVTSGPGTIGGVVCSNMTVFIAPRDSYGNELAVSEEDCSLFKIRGTVSGIGGADVDSVPSEPSIYPVRLERTLNLYAFNFSTSKAGVLHIHITANNISSSFNSVHKSGPLSVKQTCISGLGLNGTAVNRSGTFYITAVDSYGNKKNDPKSYGEAFRVQICKLGLCNVGNITVNDMHSWGGRYAVTYVASLPGNYSIHVSWFDTDVCGSPAVVPVVDSLDSRSLDATKFAICGGFPFVDTCPGLFGAIANKETSISLNAADENGIPLYVGGAQLQLTIDPLPYSTSVQDLNNGTYILSYIINVAGNYSLLVTMDDRVVLAQSIEIRPGATSAKTTKMSAQLPPACSVGTVISSTILPVDEWLNEQVYGPAYPYSNDIFAIVAMVDTGELAAGSVYTADNGSVIAIVTSMRAGIYNVSCTLNGEALLGATGLIVEFLPGPPVDYSSEVLFSNQTIAGALGSITVHLRDAFGNELNQELNCSAAVTHLESGLSLAAPRCHLTSNSTFEVEYNITYVGLYNISFIILDDFGFGTGFWCDITILPDQPSAKTSIIGRDGLTSLISGTESTLEFMCLDNWNNSCSGDILKLFTVVLDMDTFPPVYAIMSTSNSSQDGKLQVVAKFTLMHPGNYSCNVFIGAQDLQGSPFSVTALPAPSSAENSFVILDSFAGRLNTSLSSVTLAAGSMGKLKVVIQDYCGYRQDKSVIDTLNVTFYPDPDMFSDAARASLGGIFASYDKRGNGDGTYDVVFSATVATYLHSTYFISIGLIGDNGVSYDISGSPFRYQILPGEVNVAKSDVIQKERWADRYGLNWRVDLVPRDSFGNMGVFSPELKVSAALQLVDRLSSTRQEGQHPGVSFVSGDLKHNELYRTLPKITYFESNTSVYSRYNSPGYAEFRDLELLSTGERLKTNVGPAPVVIDNGNGVYSVLFSVMMAGFYNISLFINSQLVGGPWVTIPNYKVDAGPVDLTRMSPGGQGLGDNVTIAGQLSAIVLHFNDKFGNMLSIPSSEATDYIPLFTADFKIRVLEHNSSICYRGHDAVTLKNMSADDEGLIWLYYQPLKSGQLFLDLFYSSDSTLMEVVGSPFSGTVIPGDVIPGNCVAHGAGLKSAIVCDTYGCPNSTIILEARDGLDNVESSDASPGICDDFSVSADPSLVFGIPTPYMGQCLLTYLAMKVATQNVAIHYLGSPISKSPFQVVVRPTVVDTDPYKSIAAGDLSGLIVVGQTATITVQLLDTNGAAIYFSPYSGAGYVSLAIMNSTVVAWSPTTSVTDNDDGTYTLEFLAYSTGFFYFNILIGVSQIPLGGNYGGYMLQVVSGSTSLNTTSVALVSNVTAYKSGIDAIAIELLPTDIYGNLQDYLTGPLEIFEAQILQPDGATVYEPFKLISATTPQGIPYKAWMLKLMPMQAAFEGCLYTFNFLWSNGSVEQFVPLQISVATSAGPPYVPNTQVLGQGASLAVAGVFTTFLVKLYDEFNNCIVSFPDFVETVVSFTLRMGSHSVQRNCTTISSPIGASCTYVAQTSGQYTLDVKIGELGMKRFPNLVVGPGPVFTPFCQAFGDGIGQGAPLYAGTPTRFVIDVYDILNNTIYDAGSSFNVFLEADDYDVYQSNLEPDPIYPLWTGSNYEVYYTPVRAGWSWLHVTRSYMNITGSPFRVKVLAGPVSVKESTVDPASLGSCISGQIHNITLQSRDAYGNGRRFESDVFHITKLVDNAPEEWETATMNNLGKELYGVSYMCIHAGSIPANPNSTHILIEFRELEVLNFHLSVLPGPVDISKCTVALLDRAITISHVGSILVVSKDSVGNRLWDGGLNFRVVLVLNQVNVTATVNDTMDGTYLFTYTHTVSGNHTVLAFLDDQLFHQDYILVYPNAPDARSTKVTLHSKGYSAGILGSFQVQLFDMFYNNVTSDVLIHSQLLLTLLSEEIPPSVSFPTTTITYTGTVYDVHFVPRHPGVLKLQLFISDERVADENGLPYSAPVSAGPPAPSKFVLFGSGIESGGVVNQAAIFFAHIKDSVGNIVKHWPSGIWAAEFSPASLVTSTPIIVQVRNGTARVSYIPTRPSLNMAVSLMYNGEIVGPTRYVRVKAKAGFWSIRDSVALDPDGVPIDKKVPLIALAGIDLMVTIQSKDADGIDIAEIPYPSTMAFAATVGGISFPIVPTSQGPFGIIVNLPVAGRYVVEITSTDGSQYIRNSGFVVFLVPGPADPASTLFLKSHATPQGVDHALTFLDVAAQMYDENEGLRVGEEIAINLVACDKFGNSRRVDQINGDDVFSATFTHIPTSSLFNSFVTVDNFGAAHVLYLTPQVSGSYELSIFLNGVRAHTFSIEVKTSFINYSHFALLPIEDTLLEAGQLSIFELKCEDVDNILVMKENLFVDFQPSGGNGLPIQATVEPLANTSSLLVSVLIRVAGMYDVVVTGASTKITGLGPASSVITELEICSGPISSLTTTLEVSPFFLRAGEQITVYVTGRDAYGNMNCSLPGLVLTEPVYPLLLSSQCTGNSSTTNRQKCSFSIIFTPTMAGTVNISSMWNDTAVELIVIVLKTAPPTLSAAVLSDSLGTISVLFDQDTDCGYYRGGWNLTEADRCIVLLDTSTMSKLGLGPLCTFKDARTLLILLGNGASILPGDSTFGDFIKIQDDSLFNTDGTSYPVSGMVLLLQPRSPIVPVATLMGPTAVGPCDSLVLDASASSGSGGRRMQFSYSVLGSGDQDVVANLRNLLKNISFERFRVSFEPGALEQGQIYQFTVTVVNFRGAAASSCIAVKATSVPVPLLSIFGADQVRIGRRSELIQIEALATLPSSNVVDATGQCSLNTSFTPSISSRTLVYKWSQSAGPVLNLSAIVLDQRVLSIPGNQFEIENTYSFLVTCFFVGFPASVSTADLTVRIVPSPLLVHIVGGSKTVNSSEDLVIEAAVLDPDDSCDPYGLPYQVKYTWAVDPDLELHGSFLLDEFGTSIIVPAGVLGNGTYNISVTVEKEPFTRGRVGVTASVIIEANPTEYIPVSLVFRDGPGSLGGSSLAKQIRLWCDADVQNYTWSIKSETDRRNFSEIEAASEGQDTLSIPPYTLIGGSLYTVFCSVQSGNVSGAAHVNIKSSVDPSGGTVYLIRNPADGTDISGRTLYTLVAYGWTPGQGIEQGALQYEFRYLLDNSAQTVVQPLSTRNTAQDFIVEAGSVVFQVYVTNPGPSNVTSEDAPQGSLYELPSIIVMASLPESSAALLRFSRRNLLSVNSSEELFLYNEIYTPVESQGQYYSALHVMKVFGSQYITGSSSNCSRNPTLALIVNDMLRMVASTDPRYPPSYVSDTMSSGSGPYTALAVACAYSKILGSPGNIDEEELHASLHIMVNKLQQVAMHHLNVPSISGQPYDPCFFDAVDALLNAIHAECTQTSGNLMDLASRMPLWLAQIVSHNLGIGVQSSNYVARSSFSLLSASVELSRTDVAKNLTESVESFRFQVVASPQFEGTVGAAVACFPSFAPLSGTEWAKANFYKDLLAIVDVCDFALSPDLGGSQVESLVVSFMDLIPAENGTFAILHFRDGALNFDSFEDSHYNNGTVFLQLKNSSADSSRFVLVQITSSATTIMYGHLDMLLAGIALLWLEWV